MTFRILPALLLLGACAPAPSSLTDAERASAAQEVRAATFELQDALNAHDPDAILALYRLDPDFVYVGCTNYMFGGDFFGSITTTYHRQHPEAVYSLSVQALKVLAPGSALVSVQGSAGAIASLFVTRVLEKDPERGWLIVHEHESWPGCADPAPSHPGTAPGDSLIVPEGNLP